MSKYSIAILAIALLLVTSSAQAAPIIFDDFNVDEGHFTTAPFGGSGSSNGFASTSTADRVTTQSVEGAGSQQISLDVTSTTTSRLRHLSGGGSAANNTAFTTSAAEDGWVGFYMKTSDAGWNAQLWLEGASNNGSVPKNIIADGAWHLYEWNLDDTSGGADGWGAIGGIIAGTATVADGSHTFDSLILRNPAASPGNDTFYFDFLAKSDSGSIAALVPEPASMGLLLLTVPALLKRRR
jgi:hypothetical protein